MKVFGIIPARYGSTRFPGKPLALIQKKSMIRRVYEQVSRVKIIDEIVVATDHQSIIDEVESFGGKAMMTSSEHQTGTSRCWEVAQKLAHRKDDIIINIQGDEPFIQVEQIEQLIAIFQKPYVRIATLAKKIEASEDLVNENVVKVVFDNMKKAIYFSRHPIPFVKNVKIEDWLSHHNFYKHIGLYGYTFDSLSKITKLEKGKLEDAENLEQLNWIENDFPIYLDTTTFDSISVDVPEDLAKF